MDGEWYYGMELDDGRVLLSTAKDPNENGMLRWVDKNEIQLDEPEVVQKVKTAKETYDELLDKVYAAYEKGETVDAYRMYNAAQSDNALGLSHDDYFKQLVDIDQNRTNDDGISASQLRMHLAGVDMKYGNDAEARKKYDESFYHFLRGTDEKPTERIYINATADFAPEVMRHIVNEIVDNPEQFPGIYAGKIAGSRGVSDRAENIVIYTTDTEATNRALAQLENIRGRLPKEAFKDSTPYMTEQSGPGIALAAEPTPAMQRKAKSEMGGGQRSFGSLRAELIERALSEAGGQGKDAFTARVTALFVDYGIDPENPARHLSPERAEELQEQLQPAATQNPSAQQQGAQQAMAQKAHNQDVQRAAQQISDPIKEAESARHDLSHTLGQHARPT